MVVTLLCARAALPGMGKLSLVEPVGSRVFAFGQPVVLGVRLTNRTGRTQRVPGTLLKTEAGCLEIPIKRTRRRVA